MAESNENLMPPAAAISDAMRCRRIPAAFCEYALVFAGYAVALAAWTWPLAKNFFSRVPGHPALSVYAHLWHYWWTMRATTEPEYALFFSPLLFYPWGANVLAEFGNFLLPLASVPFQLFLGLAGAYNALIFLFLPAGGAAAYTLCRRFTASKAACFAAGAFLVFLPYVFMEIFNGAAEIFTLFWIPAALLALDSMLRRPAPLRGCILGAVIFLAAMSSWYYGMFMFAIAAAAATAQTAFPAAFSPGSRAQRLRAASAAAAMLAVCAATCGPFAVLMQDAPRMDTNWLKKIEDADPTATKSNPDILELAGPWQGPSLKEMDGPDRIRSFFYPYAVFPGFPLAALAALGFAARLRRLPAYYWILVAAALAFFLGPWLKVFGTIYFFGFRIPLPLFFLASHSRMFAAGVLHSYRAAAVLGMLLALPAALGCEALFDALRLSAPRRAAAAGGLLLLAGAAGIDNARLALPLASTSTEPGAIHHALARHERRGAAVNLPLTSATRATHRYLFAQTAHGRPILSGLAFNPHTYAEVNDFLKLLAKIQDGRYSPHPRDAEGVQSLVESGFDFFIAHWDMIAPEAAPALREFLESFCELVAEDEAATVYCISAAKMRGARYARQ